MYVNIPRYVNRTDRRECWRFFYTVSSRTRKFKSKQTTTSTKRLKNLCSVCCNFWFLIFNLSCEKKLADSQYRQKITLPLFNLESVHLSKSSQNHKRNYLRIESTHITCQTMLAWKADSKCVICFYFKIYNLTLYSVHHTSVT